MSLRRKRRQRLVRIKVQKLKSIVPGGHGLQLDSLFVHTASYILRLRLQIYVLKSILGLHWQKWLLCLSIWSYLFIVFALLFCIIMISFFFYCYSNLNIASYCIDQDGSSLLFYWCFSSFLGGSMVHCCWNSIFIWLWNLNQNYCTHLILKQFIYLLGGLRLFLLSHECDHSFVNLKFLLFAEKCMFLHEWSLKDLFGTQ